jgi:hypothetical protein
MIKFEYQYDIKLDYEAGKSDPYKIFMAYSEAIRSFKRIDSLLCKSLNYANSCRQTLENVQPGSIIARIKAQLEYPEDELFEPLGYAQKEVQQYMTKSTEIIFNSLNNGKIETENQIEDIQEKIVAAAKETAIGSSFSFSAPRVSEIVDALKEVSESSSFLSENESLSYTSDNTHISIPTKIEVDVKKIETEMKKTIITTKRRLILKIKMLYLIGNAQWEFKLGKQNIKAKILDNDWINSFQNKMIILFPGDALEVGVEISEEYDKYGNLIDTEHTIEKVYNIIHGEING